MADKYDDYWFGINMPSDVARACQKAGKSLVDDEPTDELARWVIRNAEDKHIQRLAARLLDRTYKELGDVEARVPGYYDDMINRVQQGNDR